LAADRTPPGNILPRKEYDADAAHRLGMVNAVAHMPTLKRLP
jgi:1,4-dihydroxy-2-naphthoyl-CoA synthase